MWDARLSLSNSLFLCFLLLTPIIVYSTLKESEDYIYFSFVKKPLLTLIDELAKKKKINISLPVEPDIQEAVKQQLVSFEPQKKFLRLREAWNLLQTFIELSGFTLIHEQGDNYTIAKAVGPNGTAAARSSNVPLFIDTPWEDLPDSDERIRYIYYLRNTKIPTPQEQENDPLTKILRTLLSKDAPFIYDRVTNAIILTDKATHTRSIANILKALDNATYKGDIVYVPLIYVKASDVAKILDSLKKASQTETQSHLFFTASEAHEISPFFSQETQVFPYLEHNALILMGPSANIQRINDFITNSIDVEEEKGESILHTYDLQYLDAATFAPRLQQMVSAMMQAQPTQSAQLQPTTTQFFKGTQIIAESYVEGKTESSTQEVLLDPESGIKEKVGIEGKTAAGGNRLIIAAWHNDWLFIKKLIEKLDTPQYQVVLEMFIVDFTYDHLKVIQGDIRSKTSPILLPNGFQFLSSNITDVNSVLGTNPTQLASDLLQVIGINSVASQLQPGSLLVSFNDPQTPGIWGLLTTLGSFLNAKITTQPYLFISNHKKGSIESQQIIRTNGNISVVSNGNFTVPTVDLSATISVVATPHILSDEKVRLEISFTLEQFIAGTINRLTRGLSTTSILRNGQILVMGGMVVDTKTEIETGTPFFSRLPFIGWFFKGRHYDDSKSHIVLFVCPTIIEPRKNHSILTQKTQDAICRSNEGNQYDLFEGKDPILRFYLKPLPETHNLFNSFLNDSSNLSDFRIEDCTKPIELLKTSKQFMSKSFPAQELKTLFAQSKPLRVNKREGKLIFNR